MFVGRLGGRDAARAWFRAATESVAAARTVDDACLDLETRIVRDIDPYAFGIFLEDPATRHLVLHHRFAHGPLRDVPIAVDPEQGMVGFVFRHGVPLVVHDVARDPRYLRGPLADAVSALAVPVRTGKDTFGALDIEADEPWTFDDVDIEGMTGLGSAAAGIVLRARRLVAPA